MPNGFCQPICRLILPVDPIPTRRRGKARRRARQADAKQAVGTNAAEQTRLRAPPGQTRLRSARKESSSFGLGRGFSRPPPRTARWIDPMANSVGAPGSALGFERRKRRKKWRRNVGKASKRLCRFRRGAERAKGRGWRRARRVEKKGRKKKRKGRKKYEGPDGAKRKKTEDQGRRPALCGAGGKKKKKPCGFFFSAFLAGASGRLNPAKRVNLA